MSGTMVDLGEQLTALLHWTDRPVDQTARELIVLELYRRHRISDGKAAELLGMDRVAFVQYASREGIPSFDLPKGELEGDMHRLAGE